MVLALTFVRILVPVDVTDLALVHVPEDVINPVKDSVTEVATDLQAGGNLCVSK